MEDKEMTIEKRPPFWGYTRNEVRCVDWSDRQICYSLNNRNADDVAGATFSYHPELAKILVMDGIYPYSKSGELMFKILKDGKEKLSCCASLVAVISEGAAPVKKALVDGLPEAPS